MSWEHEQAQRPRWEAAPWAASTGEWGKGGGGKASRASSSEIWNCIIASEINHFIKEVTVGTVTEGKCAHYLVWPTMKDFCFKASPVIADLVGQTVKHFSDTNDVCCRCYASLCFICVLFPWAECNIIFRSVINRLVRRGRKKNSTPKNIGNPQTLRNN